MTGYSSPFSHRYGTEAMQGAWSRTERLRLLFGVWTIHHNFLCEVGTIPLGKIVDPTKGLSDEQVQEIVDEVDRLEPEVGHDIVANLRVFAEHNKPGAPILAHAGLTSSDVLDQAVLHQTLFSLAYIHREVRALARSLCDMDWSRDRKVWLVGRTHLQPAEPTTLLHRFLLYTQDLVTWLDQTGKVIKELDQYRGLMSGSVGNYRNERFAITGFDNPKFLAHRDSRVKSQTLPRSLDLLVASQLDQLAAILHKVAFDYRLESGFGLTFEQASYGRVGSSAMPYKRNPINAEAIDSLSRHIHHLCGNAWDNTAWQGLDRTLDDSANRRAWLPEAFLATSEIVKRAVTLFADYSAIQSTDPRDWEDLWKQSRETAFNVVNNAAMYYGQDKKTPFFTGQDEDYADIMDEYVLDQFTARLRKEPKWNKSLDVATPYYLLKVSND